MRTCTACGETAADQEAAFCSACGTALDPDPSCGSCGRELAAAARFCPYCGAAHGAVDTAAPPVAKGAARKITSVLFGDLVGFTTLSESRDAEEVRELLTAYFDDCRAIVARYGGELEKFIGDAVMAVWGLPFTREDDAERAVRAGLELVEAVQALGDRIGVPGLNMRVGITTAEVAVNLGATGQGMVAGDPVNTAARIQSTAEPGQVWVDETTRTFAMPAIAFDDAGSHVMKGKAEPVFLWRVRAVVGGAGGERRDDGLEAQLVGRDGELRLVKEFFHRVQQTARPGLLLVDGEPGVGKSRLGWEFYKYIDGLEASVLWHRGRCLSYGEGVAYYALAEAVRARLALIVGTQDGDVDSLQGLQLAMSKLAPDPTEREWLLPRLAVLLGLRSGTTSFAREELFLAWTTFFGLVGLWDPPGPAPQPVVLVIDDAQYADEGLLAFLEHLLAAAGYPIFVLLLARPELLAEHPGLAGNRRITVLHLEPLTQADMGTLVDRLVSGVPATVRDELAARAEGVPLFAIETVRALVDRGLVDARDGTYVLVDPEGLDLTELTAPTSLQALIAARLDTLPPAERQVVDRASVLGHVFTEDSIRALCDDLPNLDDALAGLIRRQVIGRETDRLSADFNDYRFVQGMLRHVAYGMLSRRDRKAIHLQVATAFEAELESRPASFELAPIIAQHYLDAIDAVPADPDVPELTQAASDQLERAAERAAALGSPREAAAHLTMALARCASDERLAIQSKLARQLRISGEHDRAIEHATEALKAYDAADDVLGAAVPAEDLARALVYGHHELVRATDVLTEHLARIPDEPETLSARLALTYTLSMVWMRRGNAEELQRVAHESLVLAEFSGDPREIAAAMVHMGICNTHSLPVSSETYLMRALALATEHRAPRTRSLALINLSDGAQLRSVELALGQAREALVAAREIGEEYVIAYSAMNLAYTLTANGEFDAALECATQEDVRAFLPVTADLLIRWMGFGRDEHVPPLAETVGVDLDFGGNLVLRAQYELSRALEAQAAGSGDVADFLAGSLDAAGEVDVDDLHEVWLLGSEVARRFGSAAVIDGWLALVDVRKGPWPVGVVAQRSRLQAILGQDGSQTEETIETLFSEALDAARTWGSELYDVLIRADYGTWLHRQERAEEAAPLLAEARAFFERVGARRWLADLDAATAR